MLCLLGFAPLLRAQSPDVDLDHVILRIPNLQAGIDEFARRTGVTPKFGGRHPGRGTENALVSLGGGHYLEILADVDGKAQPGARLTPWGWAVHTKALPAVIARVRAAGFQLEGPTPGSRRTPDSTLLQWRTANPAGPGLELAPFVIEWADGTLHPSTTSPVGCTLVSWEIVAADSRKLDPYLAALPYQANMRRGGTDSLRLTLQCPKGQVTFEPES